MAGVVVLILGAGTVWYITHEKKRNHPESQDDVPPPADGQPGSPPPKDPYAPGSSSQGQSVYPQDMSWVEVNRPSNTVQTGTYTPGAESRHE